MLGVNKGFGLSLQAAYKRKIYLCYAEITGAKCCEQHYDSCTYEIKKLQHISDTKEEILLKKS